MANVLLASSCQHTSWNIPVQPYSLQHVSLHCSLEFYKRAFQKQNNGASLTCLLPTVSNFRVHLLVSRTIWSLTCSKNEIKQQFNETLWDLMLSQIFFMVEKRRVQRNIITYMCVLHTSYWGYVTVHVVQFQ